MPLGPTSTAAVTIEAHNLDEAAREHTAKFWQGMLETLKKLLES